MKHETGGCSTMEDVVSTELWPTNCVPVGPAREISSLFCILHEEEEEEEDLFKANGGGG